VTIGCVEPGDAALVAEVAAVLAGLCAQCSSTPSRSAKRSRPAFSCRERPGAGAAHLKPPKDLSFDPETPAATILSEVLARSVQIGASDIHFESYEDDIDVRVRVDGILHHLNTALSRENIAAAVSRLKISPDSTSPSGAWRRTAASTPSSRRARRNATSTSASRSSRPLRRGRRAAHPRQRQAAPRPR